MARPEMPLPAPATAAARFGAALRSRRHDAHLTQTELAALAGCTPATVGQIERARFLPSLPLVLALGAALDVADQLASPWRLAVVEAHSRRARDRHGTAATRAEQPPPGVSGKPAASRRP